MTKITLEIVKSVCAELKAGTQPEKNILGADIRVLEEARFHHPGKWPP
jgi:hypothetical protein